MLNGKMLNMIKEDSVLVAQRRQRRCKILLKISLRLEREETEEMQADCAKERNMNEGKRIYL